MNHLLLAFLAVFALTNCREDDPVQDPILPLPAEQVLFVLNEGNFGQNNSSISLFNKTTGAISLNFFQQQNQRGLGDTGNDLAIYGSKLYAVVNVSGTVEVMRKADAVSLQQIEIRNGSANRQPRAVAFFGEHFYVANFDNTVQQFDTTNYQLANTITAGRNPDALAVSDGKLYVSNSGGLDFPNFDNSVSVYSLPAMSLVATVEVGSNPGTLIPDGNGNVYVAVRGNFSTISPKVVRINSNHVVDLELDIDAGTMARSGGKIYFTTANAEGNLIMRSISLADGSLQDEPTFNLSGVQFAYKMSSDNLGNVYLSDAKNFVNTGDVIGFSPAGNRLFTREVGVNPSVVVKR
ncbi:MAG: YncE family protein [Luteibaculaceae bacterium]